MWQMKLTQQEDDRAVAEAIRRMSEIIDRNAHERFMKAGLSLEKKLEFQIRGCRGEIAVARFLDLPWTAAEPDGQHRKDVGDRIEVRTSDIRGNLIVKHLEQDKHHPSVPYVLAWSRGTRIIQLMGWMTIGDVLERGEAYEQGGIWYARVPYQDLIPMKELSCRIQC